MNKTLWSLLTISVVFQVLVIQPAQAKQLQAFAKQFQCSNPKLQWQYDRTMSLFDQNEKMSAKAANKANFIFDAKGVGGVEGLMYRGVTNSQFNESQILALIFNDSVAASESRWLSSQIFQKSNLWQGRAPTKDEFVPMRGSFRALPMAQKWKAFQEAYEKVNQDIQQLLSQDQFQEHVRIGSSFNATPQAIQFLTPHKNYAEGYGEFVLHVREVSRRGIDVERYNYHNPSWRYTIGSIYSMDRDEYMVPNLIPGWDVEAIKVRPGSGWHQQNYGTALYFYTKVYKTENPCDVIGIRVDMPDQQDRDERRVPKGIILKCADASGKCQSIWDNTFPDATVARLKSVIQSTKIDDMPIYFIPYAIYQAGNPDILRQMNLATLVSALPHIKEDLKKDQALWKEILEKKFTEDISSALKLVKAFPFLSALQPQFLQGTATWMASSQFKIEIDELAALLEWLKMIGYSGSIDPLQKLVGAMIDQPQTRIRCLQVLIQLSEAGSAVANTLKAAAVAKANQLKNLSPLQEIQLSIATNGLRVSDAMVAKVAQALSKDEEFRANFFAAFGGSSKASLTILEKALGEANKHPDLYPIPDGTKLWTQLATGVGEAAEKATILGLCIDYDIAYGKKTAFQLSQEVGQIGLPQDREIDTVRSLLSLAERESDRTVGKKTLRLALLADGFRTLIFEPEFKRLTAEKAKDLKALILDYYSEYMSPPLPFFGFGALNVVRRMAQDDALLFSMPKAGGTRIKIDDKEVFLSEVEHKSILMQSLSTYYLYQMQKELAKKKTPAEQKPLKDFMKEVLAGYRAMALGSLDASLSDSEYTALLKERTVWNPDENTAALLVMLAETTDKRDEKKQLLDLSAKLKRQFPEMKKEVYTPEAIQFWKDIAK